jgi:hypothetical protein
MSSQTPNLFLKNNNIIIIIITQQYSTATNSPAQYFQNTTAQEDYNPIKTHFHIPET